MPLDHSSTDFVRRNPALFVDPPGKPDLRELAGALALDALVLGEPSVTIERFDEWFLVVAKGDWLTRNSELSLVECFHRIQRFPEHRANSNRTPVVITAFAENVLVFGPEGQTVIKGCQSDLSALLSHLLARFSGLRVVAFSSLVPLESSLPTAASAP